MEDILHALRTDGIVVVGKVPQNEIKEFNDYLADKPMWDKHVVYHAQGRPATPQSSSASWSMEDVIVAPHIFERSLQYTPHAEAFLGQQPNLYSINAFTTNPIDGDTQADIQEFHRDIDDTKFIGLFMFCTDVLTPEDGPHEFVKGSQYDLNGREVEDREIISMYGEAGTMFLAVTWGLHRGLRPKTKPRTLYWCRWGVSCPPWSYGWDHLTPVARELLGDRYPQDEKMRDSIKLVVNKVDPSLS